MIGCDEALAIVRRAAPRMPAESLAPAEAQGRVLAEPVVSGAWLPPFDNAAMDGFALQARGLVVPAGTELRVDGRQAAGDRGRAATGGAWEIMTGAQLPDGLDTVVPVERVQVLAQTGAGPGTIRLLDPATPGQHLRRRGEDVAAGSTVIDAGTRVLAPQLMLLAALGVAQVAARRRPRVAVIATGRELVADPAAALQPGQIRDSNRPFLVAQLQAAGADVAWHGVVDDDAPAFQRILDRVLALGVDLVVSTGAVSMGHYDFVPEALRARRARIGFHKVAIRPGKPLLFAELDEGPLFFGLPGNPVASAVGSRFFVEPALREMLGLPAETPLRARLEGRVGKREGLRFYARAHLRCDDGGQLRVGVLPGQESFRLMPMLAANAWAALPEGVAEAAEGDCVDVFGPGHWQPVRFQESHA
ncbi:molybdopterin molybdotransferase MoeA [[Pseudomonas] boreopolis]|uniref:molybdopterin molybdotransferase MoeA n=1 Tax=Xanthomonas boreopolis TaxID=86183 RepID=UPI003D5732B0